MAASGYTPISLYYSTTAATLPSSGSLVAGELALNTLDEKLYFKNSAGTVKLLASSAGASGSVTSVAATVPSIFSISGSPITSSGTLAMTYSGTALPIANGGTNATTASITSFNNITGYSASGATGTTSTNLVFSASPTFTGTVSVTSPGAIASSRINPRTSSTASTATLTPDISAYDQYNLTAQAVALAIAAPTGTPVDGNRLVIRLLDNGTGRALTWTTTSGGYRVVGVVLPTTTVASKALYIGCVYNSTAAYWDVLSIAQQA